ncbi:MAG: hypothetical protein NC548_40420 [Lachnospiraceae bacterium]|nr:hypothetical protein [Lachnospiraceae bacterium]MCM1233303.1 hypothetical protein [Ruminococcus flavefaciens]
MGQLRDKRIVQSRIWLTPVQEPIPSYDYDYSYPVTVYDAVKRNMDDNSPFLTEEIDSIYRLINGKQDKILPGISGQIMTWSGVAGQIGSMEVVKSIQTNPSLRSNQKVPSERAVGDTLDTKVSLASFSKHVNNLEIHVSDAERARWNNMADASALEEHVKNLSLHISDAERERWNAKADQSSVEEHIFDTSNPHNVTAHQVGTYSRREIDEMFENIRESFFNYLNIEWDERTNRASLVEYHQDNWNPNYILKFEDVLPEVPDLTLTYFAVKPATDYKTNETQDCIIYIKRPGMSWLDVGVQTMNPGDMLIMYPDGAMYVWIQGRFTRLFTGDNSTGGTTGGGSTPIIPVDPDGTKVWKPVVDEKGELSWVLSADTDTPTPVIIKGKDGYTPIKGVDYNDGAPGKGTPLGGLKGDLLRKVSDDDYDTAWVSLAEILKGITLPDNPDTPVIPSTIEWEQIIGRPRAYTQLGYNEDGFIVQKTVTLKFEELSKKIDDAIAGIGTDGEDATLRKDFEDHINDQLNPHRVTPEIIGAVSTASFAEHVQNFHNPHNVTASQVGLGNVDNVHDLDKPISRATQKALDDLGDLIQEIMDTSNGANYITNVVWNESETKITFAFRDGREIEVKIPLVDIFKTVYFDQDTNELVMELLNGNEHRIDITTLIKPYLGSINDHIQISILSDNTIKATILPGTITGTEIQASVHLRNSPTTTTQAVTDKSTRIATTEFVRNLVIDNLISYETDRPLSANMGRILNQKKADIDDIIAIISDIEGIDVIDDLDSTSPVAALSANMGRHLDLVKAPRVHTSSSGSTFGRATIDLFGHVAAADTDPLMDGLVFIGTDDGRYARADHRHPHDNTRAPVNFPDELNKIYKLTGEPRAETPPNDSNDDRMATTEWIRRNAIGVSKGECLSAGKNALKIATLRSTYMNPVVFMRQIGSAISITFSNEDKSGDEITMLDVNGTGAAPIVFAGVHLKNGMIGKNHEHLFIFDGENWRLINVVPGTGVGAGSGGITFGPGGKDDDDDHTCVDDDHDGKCDICGKDMENGHEHVDNDHDGFCDICGEKTHDCLDTDGDGKCDICGDDMHECIDDNDDGICDICGKPMFGFEDDDDYGNIINQFTGFHGITIEGDGKTDIHGQVRRVWVAITFIPKASDVEVTFSKHKHAWAVKMGDGTIMRCRSPKIIETTKSSCIVQFLMENYYPANSICHFMYHTNKGWYKVEEVNHKHIDENGDGKCDICGIIMPGHAHVDDNKDGFCDVCGSIMPNHVHMDRDSDGKCDICGKDMPPDHEHVDNDGDGKCDTCGADVPECVDNDNDGYCDICGKPMFGFPDDEDYGEIINQLTGYNGITYTGSGRVDTNGQVKRAMITLNFAPKVEPPKITMSVHKNAWALRMGDGSVMRCRNPVISNITKSSAIIEFTLETYYPSNSPCMLLYHTNRAWLKID